MKSLFASQPGKIIAAVVGVMLVGALILVVVQPTLAQAKQDNTANSIEGTWRVQVTTFNCTSGVKAPPFKSVLSFAPGGMLTETTSSPAFQPGQREPGLGVWNYKGAQTYTAVSDAFILFSTAANPPTPAFQRGVQRISQTIKVNGDTFTADAIVEFLDVSGSQVMKGCASATGTRFK